MPIVDRIEARAYSYETEVTERVVSAVVNLFPSDIRPSLEVRTQKTDGHSHTTIIVVNALLTGNRKCTGAFDHMIHRLSHEDRRNLLRSLDLRLNDDCVLFLRFDKQQAYLNEIRLQNTPDVIRVQVHIRYYPRCDRKQAISDLQELLERELD